MNRANTLLKEEKLNAGQIRRLSELRRTKFTEEEINRLKKIYGKKWQHIAEYAISKGL